MPAATGSTSSHLGKLRCDTDSTRFSRRCVFRVSVAKKVVIRHSHIVPGHACARERRNIPKLLPARGRSKLLRQDLELGALLQGKGGAAVDGCQPRSVVLVSVECVATLFYCSCLIFVAFGRGVHPPMHHTGGHVPDCPQAQEGHHWRLLHTGVRHRALVWSYGTAGAAQVV